MKPIPASLTHRSTPSGPSKMFTPRASKTSALPVEPDMARLPCLATCTPAPATTNAAAVEMLNHSLPLPPVPHVSTVSTPGLTCRETSRITDAMPAISSGVSPFMRSAVTNEPNWASVASPPMICAITSAASDCERSMLSTAAWMPCWMFMVGWVVCRSMSVLMML